MGAYDPSAMGSMLRLSGSFALRGLARAAAEQGAAAASSSAVTTSKASTSICRLFASLVALPGVSRCYSGAAFVPGTDSDPEYSLKDYDVDALLASQQQPLALFVLFKTFWKYYVLNEALHANTYFTEIDRLEQEEFERGGGPLQDWPPYFSGAREWSTMFSTVVRATGRETAVKLIRLAFANFVCSLSDDLSAQRSALKLLKDAGKSAAAKRDLAIEAAQALAVAATSSSSSSTLFTRCAARAAAWWQRGPALAASAAATAFRSGLLFALADFAVSAGMETGKALLEAAREAKESERERESETEREREGEGEGEGEGEAEGEIRALVPARESSSDSSCLLLQIRSTALSVAKPLLEAVRAFFGVSPAGATPTALTELLCSAAAALSYAASTPSLIRAGGSLAASSNFLVSGVFAGSLALAASAAALRAALGEARFEALRANLTRTAVRCLAGLSVTSLAFGCGVALSLPSWTWPGVLLGADNLVHSYLIAPAMREQQDNGKVGKEKAAALGVALAAGCVAAVGVL